MLVYCTFDINKYNLSVLSISHQVCPYIQEISSVPAVGGVNEL